MDNRLRERRAIQHELSSAIAGMNFTFITSRRRRSAAKLSGSRR